MKTNIWLILGAILVCGVVGYAVLDAMTSAVAVDAAAAQTAEIREFVDERAKTRLPRTYLVTMPFHGRIEAIAVEEGQAVRRDDEYVARVVPSDMDLSVEQAQAAFERLDAAIAENDDVTVEETAFEQAGKFVESMISTVEAALARVDAGEARLAYARKDLDRTDQLFRTKTRTQDERDQAYVRLVESDVDYRQDKLVYAATLAMEAATRFVPTMVRQYITRKLDKTKEVLVKQRAEALAALKQVRQDRERGVMRSPLDGIVLKRFVSDERYLAAGEPLLEIGRLEDLEIEADVLSVDVVEIDEGDAVEIYGPAVGEKRAHGRVKRIFPAGFTKISSLGVEQQRVKVIIEIDEADRRRLLDERHVEVGYRVRVKIYTAQAPDALVIPRSALFRATDGQWQVFVIRGGRATIVDVEVGLINDKQVQVVSGLKQGEQVVLAPESALGDGDRVKAR